MRRFFTALLIVCPFLAQAQFTYELKGSVGIEEENGHVLSSPWVGGLNAAQYNTMDLDDDGKEDLVLFDRMAQKMITFLNVEDTYVYAPEYETMFPDELLNWVLLRDFNCDGKKDLFTGDLFGIRVFTNVSQGNSLTWKHYLFYVSPTSKSEALLSQGLSGLINVQMQFDDLPSISDLDGDGDLDILCMKYGSAGTLEFHKNLSMETYGTCDSLSFKLITQAWGAVKECACGEMSFNGNECGTSGGRTDHAGGKSLLALDVNGDLNMDVLLSEAECTTLALLVNEGDVTNPVINDFSFFPPASPADFLIYPAAYFEDVDFDGKKDLMITPNIFSKDPVNINLKESNWFYKNTGSNEMPEFVFMRNNFLQETMLDVGDNAVPAFADLDNDGDFDLFISNNDYPATIRVYENIGSATAPDFKFYTSDYASISTLAFRNLKIQFSDVNADGKTDLVFTATSFQTGITKIYYFLNKSAGGLDFTGQAVQSIDFELSATENIHLTQVDGKGGVDILKGRSNGALEYWRNTGNLTFTLEQGQYLGISSNVLSTNVAAATADLNADGKMDLILTDQSGKIRIVRDFKNETSAAAAFADIVFNEQTSDYYSPNLGGRIWPTVVNLFGTSRPAIIAGTIMGGLRMLKHNNDDIGNSELAINIYPNPSQRNIEPMVWVSQPAFVQLYSTRGQLLIDSIILPPNQERKIPVRDLSRGVYILRFKIGNKYYSRRLVIY